jgi:hypothetical protein
MILQRVPSPVLPDLAAVICAPSPTSRPASLLFSARYRCVCLLWASVRLVDVGVMELWLCGGGEVGGVKLEG